MEVEDESSPFLTGVIEGFYNRPWKVEQRLDLFHKLSKYRLNSYLYAPKDDAKHRSQWRQLYTEEECKALKVLIDCCKENGVQFFYGISPGLDIRYSDEEEMDKLHEKTKQIQDLGCEGFAILWDDIEPNLSAQDAKTFASFSHAHCTISNRLYNLLDKPKFLFCPIEYCSSRAVPNVKESEYLTTLGKQLDGNILVFWTGSKVVSRTVSAQEINQLREVIKRKPVLWDNLHANDYDHQRVFLGPYTGRDTSPQSYLSGVMTNPNCEYSLNVPAIVTLSDWVHNKTWDSSGLEAQNLAVKEFLASTAISAYGQEPGKDAAKVLTEDDVDLICQMFWLPHSHGPIVNKLLEDLKYCKENVSSVMFTEEKRARSNTFSISSDRGLEKGAPVADAVKAWQDRYSRVRDLVERFSNLCDKATHIANRDLLYDLSPYITNVNMMLHGWNNYLKWVSILKCKKPLQSGPTLCGLPGGLAGDLVRLYPVQEQEEYPLQAPVSSIKTLVLVLPCSVESIWIKAGEMVLNQGFQTISPIFKLAKECFIIKKGSEVVGSFVVWETKKIKSEDINCTLDFSVIDDDVIEKFPIFVKLFINDRTMETSFVGQLLESLVSFDDGVITLIRCDTEHFNLRSFESFGFQNINCKTDSNLIWLGKPSI